MPAKIDLLERTLEAWRFHARHSENELPIETFLQSVVSVDNGKIWIDLPQKPDNLGAGTRPIQLQPRLLLFLLLYHREAYVVYDVSNKFIEKIRDQLAILDFKKTRTGVTRCFTNTRFAAHTLRDYGFLKYTDNEAYKTWVLSLPGFLVASTVLDSGVDWTIPDVKKELNYDLHPDIRSALSGLKTYDQFVQCLSNICEPNVEVFGSFKEVLTKAYDLLPGYWKALQDHKLSQKDRKAETTRRLTALDELPKMSDFYAEFSACVNVERLLKDIV